MMQPTMYVKGFLQAGMHEWTCMCMTIHRNALEQGIFQTVSACTTYAQARIVVTVSTGHGVPVMPQMPILIMGRRKQPLASNLASAACRRAYAASHCSSSLSTDCRARQHARDTHQNDAHQAHSGKVTVESQFLLMSCKPEICYCRPRRAMWQHAHKVHPHRRLGHVPALWHAST